MARKSKTNTLVWILMGMLILGLGGFGVTNLSGALRSIGTVGDKDIDIDQYARALQSDIRAIEAQTKQALPFDQVQQLGIDRAVLSRVVATRALDFETDRIGLSIGDENLRRQILEIPAFQGIDGKFDREGYKFALAQSGLTEAGFENQLREETSRALVQGAIVNGTEMPAVYGATLLTYIGERRSFDWARLDQTDLTDPLAEPTDAELQAYHQTHLPAFTLPEMKRITYAWLSPEMILDQVEVDPADLQADYDERRAEFIQPERRLVERLAFADEAAASAAKARVDAGEVTFDALVTDRGLALSDVDLGDVARDDLGTEAEAVFSAQEGQVVGPFATAIGPALFRVNAVLPAQEVTFEDAEPELRAERASGNARRLIESDAEKIDNMLAGGATLEELAKDTDMQLGTIDWFPDTPADIAGYAAFRTAAAALTADDFPSVIELDDGGIVAMRLDKVIEPRIQTVEEARDKVLAGWESSETQKRLRTQAEALLPQIAVNNDMALLGLDTKREINITRDGAILGTPDDFLTQVFAMNKGDLKIIDSFGAVLIVRLTDILPPDPGNANVQGFVQNVTEQAQNGLAQDLFAIYAAAIQASAGVTIDQRALNAVHANFR